MDAEDVDLKAPPSKFKDASPVPPPREGPLVHRGGDDLQWVDHKDSSTGNVHASEGLGARAEKMESFSAPTGVRQRVVQSIIISKAYVESSWRGMRSWKEFADRTKFTTPTKMDALGRAKVNLVYFKSNYMLVMGFICIWTVLANVHFTISMLISAVAWKIYLELSDGGRNTIMLPGNRQLRPIEAYTGLSLCTFLGFYITGGSSTVFWLIATCLLVIVGHASMREAAATQAELALEELNRQDNIPPDWV